MTTPNASLGLDDALLTEMLGDFLDESQGYLALLNTHLLELDELIRSAGQDSPPAIEAETLNVMFRAAHSLKGLSAMLQLGDINRLTHKIENVFDAARNSTLTITGDVTEVMFQAFDRLTAMVEKLKDPSSEAVDCEPVVESIRQILESSVSSQPVVSHSAADEALYQAIAAGAPGLTPIASVQTERPAAAPCDPFAGIVDESEITPKYLAIFLDETSESLDALAALLAAETEPPVDALLMICHRIKGSAAAIGLRRGAKLTHAMEDLLQETRESGAATPGHVCDALLACTDSLKHYLTLLRSGFGGVDELPAAFARLMSVWRSGQRNVRKDPNSKGGDEIAQSHLLTAADWERLACLVPTGATAIFGVATLEPNLPLSPIKARFLLYRLQKGGELYASFPSIDELDSLEQVSRVAFAAAIEGGIDRVRDILSLDGVLAIDLTPSDTKPNAEVKPSLQSVAPPEASRCAVPSAQPETKTSGASTEDPGQSRSRPTETVRVDIDRLDHLMNLAGQLTINKARFNQIGDRLTGLTSRRKAQQTLCHISAGLERILEEIDDSVSRKFAQDDLMSGVRGHVRQIRGDLEVIQADLAHFGKARALANDLSEAVHQLERISGDIQKSVMDTRMVPIGPLFDRFKRVVRDITRANGKEIQLVIRGEKTELDKRMIDELSDPLIHMVRNSADHGIESPDERAARGKPRRGVITLDAFHRGNRVFIRVSDDGKGLDAERIRQKAVEKGLITTADAERLTPSQTYQLIWEPGFSTAEKVTEVSGRGMGMDIVRSKIEQLSGAIELDSQPGQGASITIKLPLTMAILPSLLTVIGGEVYAVPVESVSEIVRIRAVDCASVHGVRTARIRGRVISLVSLADLFSLGAAASGRGQRGERGEETLVIIGAEGAELGLIVDDLLGEEDIVIKSLAENYRNIAGLAGASILGDGRVSLILDVAALVAAAGRNHSVADNQPSRSILV